MTTPSADDAETLRDLVRFFESTDELLCVATMDGYFKRLNPAWSRLLGYTREELTSRPFTDFVHPEDQQPTFDAMSVLADGRAVKGFVNRYLSADGSYRFIQWNAQRSADDASIYAVARDVTEQEEAKRQLEATEDQLRHAQKLESIGLLAGGIAHDFNNLLVSILSFGTLVQDELPQDNQLRDDMQQIIDAGQRAAELTGQLLALSRRQVLLMTDVDCGRVVLDMQRILARTLGEAIELRIDAEPGRHWVRADRGQLEQVLMNLIVNARDAMPDGGTLGLRVEDAQLEAREPGGPAQPLSAVQLSVRDTGLGMDARTRAQIFEPFFTTKGPGHGTGLGLAMAHGIVTQSGGNIEVESEPGGGSEFRVRLPRIDHPQAGASSPSSPMISALPPTSQRRGAGRAVLVVEDEPSVQLLIRRVLERDGFRVLLASNPGDALLLAERGDPPIGLILSDVVLPHIDGVELAHRLRHLLPHCPILFVTGYTELGKIQDPTTVPGAQLLPKPFLPSALLEKVYEALDRQLASLPSVGRIPR